MVHIAWGGAAHGTFVPQLPTSEALTVAVGVNATDALVYSQVVLSFALPVPMIALVIFTCRRDIMGSFVNSWLVSVAAILGTVLILFLNVILLLQTFGMNIPGLPSAGRRYT
jgi:manganese transport protein